MSAAMKYPDPSDASLVELQDRLAAGLMAQGNDRGPDAAEAMLGSIAKRYKDSAARIAAVELCLRGYGLAIDGPMPEAVPLPVWTYEYTQEPEPEAPRAQPTPKPPVEQPKRPTWNDTVNAPSGRPRHKQPRPGPVAAKINQKYLPNGNLFRMPNDFAEQLLAVMPGPVLKGYLYAHRIAGSDGVFYVSAGKLAAKIGSKSTRHGQRVLARLQQAGLLRFLERGSAETKRANVYQLVPLESLDLDRVRETLSKPLNGD